MNASTQRFLLFALVSLISLHAQAGRPAKPALKVDEISRGPFGGQKSASCLRVYADRTVIYAEWSTSAVTLVDRAGTESRPEHTSAFSYQLSDGDFLELSGLLESKAVTKLSENFGPPHKPVDYFERVSVEIPHEKGPSKKLSTREYYVADLEEKTRYPSALILLMDRIDQMEKAATSTGVPTEVPNDCSLKEPSGKH
jgi:hypothetical protein